MKKTMMAAMVAALVCVAVVLGIYPADRTVWCVEMVWAVGLWAVLLLTRRKFRFSTPAYLCFFVWTVLQLVGAHYTFEHVPMEWLMKPLGLVRNPYDRIAHFAVGWFAFPLAELFFRKNWVNTRMKFARAVVGAAVAVCMEGCNTVEHSALPEASVSGDIVRASFTITENPDRCECTDSGKKVTREGFRRAITQLAKMPPGKELDLSVTTDYLCWQECYPRDYESELSALSALTNFESISLAIRETHGKLDFSALAKLPLRNLTIDSPLCMPSPYLEVSGLESSPVERLTLIGCFGVKGFCDLPRLETCECKLDAFGCYEIPASEIRSRFPSVRSVLGNGVYPPDLPLCIATNGVTSLSYREWGALNGPDERYSIDFAQRRVSAEVYNYSLRDNANPCVLKCERLCNREDWEKLLACIEEANVVGWEERYSANICDGTLWRVELVNGTNIVKRIDGNNAAPPEFKKFCAVKQIVFGKFGGCSLWYPKLREEMLESINAADACAENESGKEATK